MKRIASWVVTWIIKQPMRDIQAPHQIWTTKLCLLHPNLAWGSLEFSISVLNISKPLQYFKRTQVWTTINQFSLKGHQYIKQRTFTIHIHRYINIINFNYSNSDIIILNNHWALWNQLFVLPWNKTMIKLYSYFRQFFWLTL